EACRLRLRPILMTSFAFILGVLPLVGATGAGMEMRRALGGAGFRGVLGGAFFGPVFSPGFLFSVSLVSGQVWRETAVGAKGGSGRASAASDRRSGGELSG